MAYVKQEWKNLPNQTTPANATRMSHIEDGIASIDIFKNLFNVGNSRLSGASVTFSNTDNQIKINGTSNTSKNIFLDSPSSNKDKEGIILKPGTYTATIRKISGSLNNNIITFYLKESNGTNIYDGNSIFSQVIEAGVPDGTAYSKTFTLTEETRFHWMGYFGDDLRTFNNLVLQFQIEESSSATEYTPFAGYIVESGSNSNGNWIKYSDGTMIAYGDRMLSKVAMTNPLGSMFESSSLSLGLFPINFETIPVVFINKIGSAFAQPESVDSTTISSLGTANWYRPTSRTMDIKFGFLAIGRWK